MLIWLLSSCTQSAVQVQKEVQKEKIIQEQSEKIKTIEKEINDQIDTEVGEEIEEQKLESFRQNVEIAKQKISSSQNHQSSIYNEEIDDDKTLLVNNKCIACNKCIRIAPDNFVMDWDNRIAVVTSQEWMHWDTIARAIARCPVDAIEIA